MKKKFILFVLMFFYGTNLSSTVYYVLNSRFISYLDGIPNCLDGKAIYEILQVKAMVKNLKFKAIVNSKTQKPLYYKGKPCIVSQISPIEHTLANCPELKTCLSEAKNKFINKTLTFMNRIKGAKAIMINLMKDSCGKRNIKEKDTILLEWANTNGNEKIIFNEKIKNFKDFDKFLAHVNFFLGDLLKSCPKGFAQYQKDIKPLLHRKNVVCISEID